jgi:hypothetical protein
MSESPDGLEGLRHFLESLAKNDAEKVLDSLGVRAHEYGMDSPAELIAHWQRCIEDLTGRD